MLNVFSIIQLSSGPLNELWNYEVVEIFFLASKNEDMYLEVEFGPHGQHLGLLLKGKRNILIHSFPIKYEAEIGMYLPIHGLLEFKFLHEIIWILHSDETAKEWKGKAFIPNEYFPPNVDQFNAYAIHGLGDQRKFKSLFPFNPNLDLDFHRLEFFKPLNLTIDQGTISSFWQEALDKNA